MTPSEQILEVLAAYNPQIITWDGFDAAIIGIADRCGQPALVIYDYEKMVRILVKRDGMTDEEAREYIDFNFTGGWAGEHTPICLRMPQELEELL